MLDWNNTATWHILVIDDERDNLDLVVEALGYHGAGVVESAKSGVQGLEKLTNFQPNMILLDLSMPEVDGFETLQRLRQMAAHQQTPVVAMTAHAMRGDKERVLEAGFDGYITKPISVMTLIQDIRLAVRDWKNRG